MITNFKTIDSISTNLLPPIQTRTGLYKGGMNESSSSLRQTHNNNKQYKSFNSNFSSSNITFVAQGSQLTNISSMAYLPVPSGLAIGSALSNNNQYGSNKTLFDSNLKQPQPIDPKAYPDIVDTYSLHHFLIRKGRTL